MDQTLLIVDDERVVRETLSDLMGGAGYAVTTVGDGQEALDVLEASGPDYFRYILCDLKMPRVDGLEFLERSKAMGCTATIIVMSAYGTVDRAVEALKLGAYDYISKPFKTDEVRLALKKAEERERLLRENRDLRAAVERDYRFENLIARSPKMQAIFDLLRKVADYRSTVLLHGESGAGKELLARALHYNSNRKDAPFVAVNCTAIPERLLESEIFGHEAGALSDSSRAKAGAFEQAQGGTLFLDEVGQLPEFLQVRLLRSLQEGVTRRMGGGRDIQADVRVVAATIRDLAKRVAEGSFREDLFYRLNVIPIRVPPLRERRDDIPLLVEHFVARYARETGKELRGVTPEAMEALLRYSWKGNVRELENVVERAVVLVEGPLIDVGHIGPWLQEDGLEAGVGIGPNEYSIKKVTARVEDELIRRALRKTRGNRTAASRLLEISHRTLLYKMKDYGIEFP